MKGFFLRLPKILVLQAGAEQGGDCAGEFL
jgi:hypothetical protein